MYQVYRDVLFTKQIVSMMSCDSFFEYLLFSVYLERCDKTRLRVRLCGEKKQLQLRCCYKTSLHAQEHSPEQKELTKSLSTEGKSLFSPSTTPRSSIPSRCWPPATSTKTMPLIAPPPPTSCEEADHRWVLPQFQLGHHFIDARSKIGQSLPSARGGYCPRRVFWRGERGEMGGRGGRVSIEVGHDTSAS